MYVLVDIDCENIAIIMVPRLSYSRLVLDGKHNDVHAHASILAVREHAHASMLMYMRAWYGIVQVQTFFSLGSWVHPGVAKLISMLSCSLAASKKLSR